MVKNELFYDLDKYQKYYKIQARTIGYYQMDTLVYQLPKGSKKGIYILVVIDIYSRKLGCCLKYSQTGKDTLKAYKFIIKEYFDDINPIRLSIDAGVEFLNKEFKAYLEKEEIEIHLCQGDGTRDKNVKLHNSIVERVNATIRYAINHWTEVKNRDLDANLLDEIVNEYNSRVHKSIGEKPEDVFDLKAVPKLVLYKHNPSEKTKEMEYKVGDKVRVSLQMSSMEENRKRKMLMSRDVYRIIDKDGNKYLLDKVKKWFPYSRLKKTKESVSKDPSNVFTGEKVKNIAPEMNKKEKEKKHRVEPKSKSDKALMDYNKVWDTVEPKFKLNEKVKVKASHFKGKYKEKYFIGTIKSIEKGKTIKYEIEYEDSSYEVISENQLLKHLV